MSEKVLGAVLVGVSLLLTVCSVNAGTATTELESIMTIQEFIIFCIATAVIAGIAGFICHFITFEGDTNMKTKTRALCRMFRKAEKYIHIQTDLDGRFFNNPEVIKTLDSVARRGVAIKILYDCDEEAAKPDDVPKLKGLAEQGLVELIASKVPFRELNERHYMIVDGRKARVEMYHPPLRFGEKGIKAKGIICKGVPEIALIAEHKFNNLLRESKKEEVA